MSRRNYRQAHAQIKVTLLWDRYRCGEMAIWAEYHGEDAVWLGKNRRVALRGTLEQSVPGIWDLLFDEALRVQSGTTSTELTLDLPARAQGWQREGIAALACVVAHELQMPFQLQ